MPERSLIEWVATLSRALSGAGVEHALAGGLAVAVWARPRATVDIDLVAVSDAASIESARSACRQLGLLQTKRRVAAFRRIRMLRMSIPPTRTHETISVDFLFVPEVLEREILSRAQPRMLGGATVSVVSAEDTVLLKLLRFDDQDRADIRAIAAERRLDRRYLRRMARQLRVLTRLRAVGLR